jgi:hypothetical protein
MVRPPELVRGRLFRAGSYNVVVDFAAVSLARLGRRPRQFQNPSRAASRCELWLLRIVIAGTQP